MFLFLLSFFLCFVFGFFFVYPVSVSPCWIPIQLMVVVMNLLPLPPSILHPLPLLTTYSSRFGSSWFGLIRMWLNRLSWALWLSFFGLFSVFFLSFFSSLVGFPDELILVLFFQWLNGVRFAGGWIGFDSFRWLIHVERFLVSDWFTLSRFPYHLFKQFRRNLCINDRNEFDDEDGGEVQIELGLWLIIMKEIVEIRLDSCCWFDTRKILFARMPK